MTLKRVGLILAAGAVILVAATPLGRDLLFHALPMAWTGEAERLARALRLGPGATVADIGAGNGALIAELAGLVAPGGHVFATERTPEQRRHIEERLRSGGVAATVVAAGDDTTSLRDACCDAITMRMVMHHITNPATFARDLRRSIKAGGRIGIIDFGPGALPHLADDHGVAAEEIVGHFLAAGFELETRDDAWGGRSYLLVFRAP